MEKYRNRYGRSLLFDCASSLERNISSKIQFWSKISTSRRKSKKIEKPIVAIPSRLPPPPLSRARLYNLTQIYARLKFPGSAAVGKQGRQRGRSLRINVEAAERWSPSHINVARIVWKPSFNEAVVPRNRTRVFRPAPLISGRATRFLWKGHWPRVWCSFRTDPCEFENVSFHDPLKDLPSSRSLGWPTASSTATSPSPRHTLLRTDIDRSIASFECWPPPRRKCKIQSRPS